MEQLLLSLSFPKAGTSWSTKGREGHLQHLPVGGTLDHSGGAGTKGGQGSRKAHCMAVLIPLGLGGRLQRCGAEPGLKTGLCPPCRGGR